MKMLVMVMSFFSCASMYLSIGMYEGDVTRCVAHAAVDLTLGLVVAVGTELCGRLYFLQKDVGWVAEKNGGRGVDKRWAKRTE